MFLKLIKLFCIRVVSHSNVWVSWWVFVIQTYTYIYIYKYFYFYFFVTCLLVWNHHCCEVFSIFYDIFEAMYYWQEFAFLPNIFVRFTLHSKALNFPQTILDCCFQDLCIKEPRLVAQQRWTKLLSSLGNIEISYFLNLGDRMSVHFVFIHHLW